MYTENKQNKANRTCIIYAGIILVRKSMKITETIYTPFQILHL